MWKLRCVTILSCILFFGCGDSSNDTTGDEGGPNVDVVVDSTDIADPPPQDVTVEDTAVQDTAVPPEDLVEVCEPDCEEKTCGEDGCGGNCGECDEGSSCEDSNCVVDCVPDCEGKNCGSDKCGGSCGSCPNDAPLCHAGVCEALCVPDCEGKEVRGIILAHSLVEAAQKAAARGFREASISLTYEGEVLA